MSKNYYLVGIKHCGKSSVGKQLSQTLNLPFYDLDNIIEDIVNKGVREFYKEFGKDEFQRVETLAINKLQHYTGGFVCATGGGICDNLEASKILKNLQNIIYINTDFETVYTRIISNGIPAFLQSSNPKEEFKDLYINRNKLYTQLAKIEVSGNNLTPNEIVKNITLAIEEQ